MTRKMKSLMVGLILVTGWNVGLPALRAQTTATSEQSVQAASDLQVMLEVIESVPPVPASQLPASGTFWSAQHSPASATSWPPLPGNIFGLSAWPLGDGIYLLDDTNVNYSELALSQSTGGFDSNFQPLILTTNMTCGCKWSVLRTKPLRWSFTRRGT